MSRESIADDDGPTFSRRTPIPTNYNGDPTATEAPSASPLDDGVPTFALVADGDNENAASVAQPAKATADWLAWLRRPRAKIAAWATAIQRWQNARLQVRFLIDHMGFPGGRIFGFWETWTGEYLTASLSSGTGTATLVGTGGSYFCHVASSTAALSALKTQGPAGFAKYPSLLLQIGDGASDIAEAYGNPCAYVDTDRGFAIEFPVATSVQTLKMRVNVGLANTGLDPYGVASTFVGAVFYKGNGDANWQCITGDGTTLGTPVDSGVAFPNSGESLLRIEYSGSGTADNTTTAVRFYIDGVLRATMTANLPPAAAKLAPVYALQRDTGGGAGDTRLVQIGPARFWGNF